MSTTIRRCWEIDKMACKYYGDCEHQSGWCKSDSILVKCNYGLNRLCDEQIIKIADLEDENKKLKQQLEAKNIELAGKLTDKEVFQYGCMLGDAHKKISELKRLLKLAVEDLHYYTDENNIHFLCDICCKNPVDCAEKDECYFEWEHADEVKELLNDGEK